MRKILLFLLHFFFLSRMMMKYVLSISLTPYAEHFTSYMSHNMCLTLLWYIRIHITSPMCSAYQLTRARNNLRRGNYLFFTQKVVSFLQIISNCYSSVVAWGMVFYAQRAFKYLLIHFPFSLSPMISQNCDDEMGVSWWSFFKFERWDGENYNQK